MRFGSCGAHSTARPPIGKIPAFFAAGIGKNEWNHRAKTCSVGTCTVWYTTCAVWFIGTIFTHCCACGIGLSRYYFIHRAVMVQKLEVYRFKSAL